MMLYQEGIIFLQNLEPKFLDLMTFMNCTLKVLSSPPLWRMFTKVSRRLICEWGKSLHSPRFT